MHKSGVLSKYAWVRGAALLRYLSVWEPLYLVDFYGVGLSDWFHIGTRKGCGSKG